MKYVVKTVVSLQRVRLSSKLDYFKYVLLLFIILYFCTCRKTSSSTRTILYIYSIFEAINSLQCSIKDVNIMMK